MEWDSAVDTAPCCRAITLNCPTFATALVQLKDLEDFCFTLRVTWPNSAASTRAAKRETTTTRLTRWIGRVSNPRLLVECPEWQSGSPTWNRPTAEVGAGVDPRWTWPGKPEINASSSFDGGARGGRVERADDGPDGGDCRANSRCCCTRLCAPCHLL